MLEKICFKVSHFNSKENEAQFLTDFCFKKSHICLKDSICAYTSHFSSQPSTEIIHTLCYISNKKKFS
jgi:hypothetical protein